MEWFNYSTEREILKLIYKTAHRCVMFCENIFKPYGITFPQSVLMFLIKEHQDRIYAKRILKKWLELKAHQYQAL